MCHKAYNKVGGGRLFCCARWQTLLYGVAVSTYCCVFSWSFCWIVTVIWTVKTLCVTLLSKLDMTALAADMETWVWSGLSHVQELTLTEVVVPIGLMFLLGLIHSQTVLAHFSLKPPRRDGRSGRYGSTHCFCDILPCFGKTLCPKLLVFCCWFF